jgi:hypothetical protein
MTQTGVTVSLENAYTVFYGQISSSGSTILTDVSGNTCFTDPCVTSSGNIISDCYLADGIREFIAAITVEPVVSFFPCENGLSITISPIPGSSTGSCPIQSFDTSGSFVPLTFNIGFNQSTSTEATLISILTLANSSGSLNYLDVSAMYAPVEFDLLDVNGNPTDYTNACSIQVKALDTCFKVYFGILRCCQGYNFILVSDIIALQFFYYTTTGSIYILTISESGLLLV